MYGNQDHPAGGQPPTPSASGPGIVGGNRPPNLAPNLGTSALPKSVPQTAYPLAGRVPSQVGPTGTPAPRF